MSLHLDPEDLITAIDGQLPHDRQAHLDGCLSCRAALVEARETLEAVAPGGEVPEPSPLFWEHVSARIQEATEDEPPRRRDAWWIAAWKPLAAGCAAATLLWVAGLRPTRAPSVPVAHNAATDSATAAATWDEVVAGVDALSIEDVSTVASVALETSVLVDDLTPAERDVLATLIEYELGRLQ